MTTTVEILVPGLWPRPGEERAPPTPALLEKMLARGGIRSSSVAGWEAAVAARLGLRKRDTGRRRWLALPVSMTAGMTDAVAHPVDDLTPDEATALSGAIAPELDAASAVLREASPGVFELELEGAGNWDTPPPSAALGRPIDVPRLDNPVARRLQVLGSAVQMAWFNHPVNEERVRSGRTPVRGLWFWSPGVPTEAPAVRRIAGGGAIARWLATTAGVTWSADPLDQEADLAVVDTFARAEHIEHRADLLASLSEDVLEPRVGLLRAGQIAEILVHDPGVALLRLRRSDWRRFWRRPTAMNRL